MTTPPTELRLDHGPRLLGVTARAPRFGWLLPAGSRRQEAYELRVGGWSSSRVESDRTLAVPYAGPALASRQEVEATVRVWTDLGESAWSEPLRWEMGLLDPDDWSASLVGPDEHDDEVAAAGHRPAYVLSSVVELASAPVRARAYATAHGLYELFVDGRRVGDLELTPGFTAYRSHLEVQTFDLGDLLHEGTNRIEVVLSDGWWRGQVGFTREHDAFGPRTAALVQVEVVDATGATTVVGTDGSWTWATGPIVAVDLIEGQREDHRRSAGPSRPVVVHDLDRSVLTSSPAPPTRRVEEVVPVSVSEPVPGSQVVDLGQNINGWARLHGLGPEGTTVRLTHGERLHPDGTVDVDHLAPFDFLTREALSPGQVDEVVAGGGPDEVFEPRHTTHGFQFVQVDGRPDPVSVDDVRGVVVHTDLRRTGWFRCSDERINAFHDATVWSFRDNACEIPTDCPQRERAGWTGDWQIFAPSAAFLHDVAGFSARWLRDLAADQWPDGRVPNFVPDPIGPRGHDHPVASFITGSAGWGDAAVIVPWEMWIAYGDDRFLADQYDSGVAWVEFAEARAAGGRHATRQARGVALPHERYLWDSGFHWGEWCEPGGNPEGLFTLEVDVADVATAFFCRSASLLSRTAAVLGREADVERWNDLAANVRDAWRTEFVADDGTITPDTQANLVRALAFDLVPDELRAATAARLAELVREADDHLSTGFLATPDLLPVLADAGHVDVAYDLLLQDTPPSWLAMIDAGATTVWENWEGIDADGLGSLNHYSKGAVVGFLHRYVAGIRPDDDHPAYGRFTVRPLPGGGLTSAEANLDSPRGRIESRWHIANGTFHLDVVVPPGSEANVVLPDGTTQVAAPGTWAFTSPHPA
ncbi:MAG: family 78 glycoside hydrolase catalytic domain [Actinobacteria bacterium]|nr:family 78 glycoside hydrolase catalytic domain [Actinomycetota bacterium]